MSLLIPVLFMSSVTTTSGNSVDTVVTVTPSWSYFYAGESGNLTCNEGETQGKSRQSYYWDKDGKYIWDQKQYAFSALEEDSGLYQCSASGYNSYNGVRLQIISRGSSPTPLVTFDPDWRQIFRGENMTMKCNVLTRQKGQYSWYRYRQPIEKENGQLYTSAGDGHTENYQCRFGSGSYSFPIRLDVIQEEFLILQAPSITVEGDTLRLRCHSRATYYENKETLFYKDGITISPPGYKGHTLNFTNANTSMSGRYKCAKKIWNDRLYERETYIFIEDLFLVPEISSECDPVIEGDYMSLTCSTRLHPLRPDTQLQYAFYRNGQKVREFRTSNEYEVQSARLENSGKYTCEVTTCSDTVRKTSAELLINIQEMNPSLTEGTCGILDVLPNTGNYGTLTSFLLTLSACVLVMGEFQQ